MRPTGIGRNYAEALYQLAEPKGTATLEQYAGLIEALAAAIETSPQAEAVLMSPRVPKAVKAELVAKALDGAPREFVRFAQAVVRRGRQGWFREIASDYATMVDAKFNRLRVAVTVARKPDAKLQKAIKEQLSAAFGKEVLPSFAIDPSILGGTIVRVGDRTYDGSIRRRMAHLRRELLTRK